MKERIREILKNENLTSAQFADRIGVQRSSISHILSGRNKPGFDFIQKIITNFPEINAEWLITGNGRIYKQKAKSEDLFEPTIKPTPDKELYEDKLKNNMTLPENSVPQYYRKSEESKKIERILVFYNDKTFREYNPENE